MSDFNSEGTNQEYNDYQDMGGGYGSSSGDKFIDRGNAIANWVDKLFKFITKYGWYKIVTNIMVLSVIGIIIWFFFYPKSFVNHFEEISSAIHQEKLQKSLNVRGDIQKTLDNVVTYTDARSATLFELHNTQVGFGGVPFIYASPSMESLRSDINSFAKDLKDVNLGMIRAAQDAYKNGLSKGYVEDLKENDKLLYGLMSAPGITYYAMFLVPGDKLPIAFLVVAYDEEPKSFNVEKHAAKEISDYLSI